MDADRLIYMANQIARNFAAQGEDVAVVATADHIAKFWDPRMKAASYALLAQGGSSLSPVSRRALEMLSRGCEPAPQTPATKFNAVDEIGRSDAG